MITTTPNRVREHMPSQDAWLKLLHGLRKTKPDDKPLPYSKILKICGMSTALLCLRAEPQHSAQWRKMAVAFASDVRGLMADPRSLAALDVAERHADGVATDAELGAAWNSAMDATGDFSARGKKPNPTLCAAAEVAAFAVRNDAHEAARDAAEMALWALSTAASGSGAYDWEEAVCNLTRDRQTRIFLEIVA